MFVGCFPVLVTPILNECGTMIMISFEGVEGVEGIMIKYSSLHVIGVERRILLPSSPRQIRVHRLATVFLELNESCLAHGLADR